MGLYVDRGYTLEEAKNGALLEVESWYGGATLDTFDCNVLGSMYRYYCDEASQLRFLHGKTSNLPITLMCGPVVSAEVDPVWAWVSHTATECGKVHGAYLEFIKAAALQYQAYKAQVPLFTSVQQADDFVTALWS